RMMDEGHGYGGLHIEITWYGWIHVEAIDLSEAGKDFRRHMMGAAREDGWGVLDRAAVRVEALLAVGCIERSDMHRRSSRSERMVHIELRSPCTLRPERHQSNVGAGPPLGPTPFPHAGRGAEPSLPATPKSRLARARVLVKAR
ncbi:MAG: hypothetical protein AAFQ22_16375, partial [Pseudomonadota bacterium]